MLCLGHRVKRPLIKFGDFVYVLLRWDVYVCLQEALPQKGPLL